MLNCRFPVSPGNRLALYPLSYGRMERPAGLEPATTRLSVEVTDIFTTDHAKE